MAAPSEVIDKLRPLRPPPPDGMSDILLMTIVGCVLAAALACALHWIRERRRPLRRVALASLTSSRTLPPDDRLAAQAQLLREIAGVLDHDARMLQGDAWLARLDALFSTKLFSDGPGRAFGKALYRPLANNPAEALDGELARLFARLDR
jgi:Domain of unknown function (DUF4381)